MRSAWKTGDLLDRQQQLAGLDRLTALDKDLVDLPSMRATTLVSIFMA